MAAGVLNVHIGVMGAGAVGCYFGGRLAQAGHDVTLVGRAQYMLSIRNEGLVLLKGDTRVVIPVAACSDPAALAASDIVLLTVKSADTVSAATELLPYLRPGAVVISLQNGVDNAERAAAVLGRPVLASVVYVGVEMRGDGAVRLLGRGDLVLGETDPGAVRVAALLNAAGIPCALVPDVQAALWQKLVINCAYNPVSALADLPYGELIADPGARALMMALADEAIAVAMATGVRLDTEALRGGLWQIGEAMPGQFSSTAQDLRRWRKTEINALNGHVADLGERHGVPVPVSRTVTTLVRLRELTGKD